MEIIANLNIVIYNALMEHVTIKLENVNAKKALKVKCVKIRFVKEIVVIMVYVNKENVHVTLVSLESFVKNINA